MMVLNKYLLLLITFVLTTPLIPQSTGKKVSLLEIGSEIVTDGCLTVEGEVLPSPDYLSDDLHYFPPGQEFKLSGTKDK